ncbi:MAG TPA: vitamin B12 dependent-methionine synthase activation domain-containing protein, partial [Gammaproteobacteria bacterium]|nr:vitamin B12 dependent-methionine synthase activation domain-containing protein [Gammaproteobacteria bacterium]
QPNLALADFIAPRESGVRDYIGAFALSAGFEVSSIVQRLEKEHDDYQAIMLRAIADRLAEAFSEAMHERVRRQLWGHAGAGIRPAPGYPTNPDHTEKLLLWKLLDAERNTGIVLTENLAMSPAASVCGLYFSHPDSRYFGIGKLPRDQVADYAGRKGLEQGVMEKWLGPHLAYDSANC